MFKDVEVKQMEMTAIERVASAALNYPDRIALTVEGERWTYRELMSAALGLAAQIQNETVESLETPVAFVAQRTASAYVAVLAAMLTGRPYVPLNPKFSAERNNTIISKSQASLVICGSNYHDRLMSDLSEELVQQVRVIRIADDKEGGVSCASCEMWSSLESRLPCDGKYAYILFTSGSTGVPKGVRISQRNLTEYLNRASERMEIVKEDCFSQTFDLTFDLSVHDMFLAWSHGAHLVVASAGDLFRVADYIRANELTQWFSVPSLVYQLKAQGGLYAGAFPSLKCSLFCGEALPMPLALEWTAAAPRSVVENWYGPTEATIACTWYRLSSGNGVVDEGVDVKQALVPIGIGFSGTRTWIVKEDLSLTLAGESGELLLEGSQVAEGYLRDEKRTGASFVSIPHSGGVCYRTGDRVVADATGCIHYLDRLDNQVKIRGYRIELGEIEAALRKANGGRNSIAIPWPVGVSAPTSIFAAIESEQMNEAPILETAKQSLPAYMVPSRVVFVPQFPTNASGKTDRKRVSALVKEMLENEEAQGGGVSFSDPLVAKLWTEIEKVSPNLSPEQILKAPNLLAGGVDSLGFVELMVEVERVYDIALTQEMVTVLADMSLAVMAKALAERNVVDGYKKGLQTRAVRAAQFLARFPRFAQSYADHYPEDICLLLGSSGVFRGISTRDFDEAARTHGWSCRSVNIGLPAVNGEGLAQVSEFIRDHCKHVKLRVKVAVVELEPMHLCTLPPKGDIKLPKEWLVQTNTLVVSKDAGEYTWSGETFGNHQSASREGSSKKKAQWERQRDMEVAMTYNGQVEFVPKLVECWKQEVRAMQAVSDKVIGFVHPIDKSNWTEELQKSEGAQWSDLREYFQAQLGIEILDPDSYSLNAGDFEDINHVTISSGKGKLSAQLAVKVIHCFELTDAEKLAEREGLNGGS